MTETLAKIYARAPKPRSFVIYGSADLIEATNNAFWDIVMVERAPCPICTGSMMDGHCPDCDYPYNEK